MTLPAWIRYIFSEKRSLAYEERLAQLCSKENVLDDAEIARCTCVCHAVYCLECSCGKEEPRGE